jgi:hypothetical protein
VRSSVGACWWLVPAAAICSTKPPPGCWCAAQWFRIQIQGSSMQSWCQILLCVQSHLGLCNSVGRVHQQQVTTRYSTSPHPARACCQWQKHGHWGCTPRLAFAPSTGWCLRCRATVARCHLAVPQSPAIAMGILLIQCCTDSSRHKLQQLQPHHAGTSCPSPTTCGINNQPAWAADIGRAQCCQSRR